MHTTRTGTAYLGTKIGTYSKCGDDSLNKRARGLCWDLTFCYVEGFSVLVAMSGRVVMRNYRGSIPFLRLRGVAQLVEQGVENSRVGASIPPPSTTLL